MLLNLILRLRESFVLRGLREEQLALVIADAAGPLRSCAAALLELSGSPAPSPKEALERGRHNIEFLIVLSVIACIGAGGMALRRYRAIAAIEDLRLLFSRLKDRAAELQRGGATADAALLAAIFGLRALPAPQFAFALQLFPAPSRGGGGSDSGDSSGCGSSCGSGCGGGGGCGGCGS